MDVLRMEIQLTEIHCNAAISVTWLVDHTGWPPKKKRTSLWMLMVETTVDGL
mgnify:CR=1 FL=1